MSRNCLDAGLIGAQFLEESVICLQIEHARAFSIRQRRRRFRIENIHQIVFDVQVDHVWRRIVDMIVRLVLVVWRIVAGKNQVGIVIVAIINDNIWFLGRPIFGDDLHVGLVIRPRVCVRLLIGRGEVVVHTV